MLRFKGLEGARAWLAWAVVASHLAQLTGLVIHFPKLIAFQKLGDVAVQVFIIVSGFVIYHLICGKKERYIPYIIRRFMRLYPVYIICLTIGILATILMFGLLPTLPWGGMMPASDRLLAQIASYEGGDFYIHILAHLSLLHGAIPSNILYESEYFFLSPAWSLSLEWQFYIVAPLVVWLIARQMGRIVLVVATVAAYLVYVRGGFGVFILPSFLPGASLLFAVGILTRMAVPKIDKSIAFSGGFVALSLGLAAVGGFAALYLAIWLLVVVYMLTPLPSGGVDRSLYRFLAALLDSRLAVAMGARSYCVYIVHVPIIQLAIYTASKLGMTYYEMAVFVVIASPAAILAVAELLHRWVEKPGIKLGHRIADGWSQPSLRPAPAT